MISSHRQDLTHLFIRPGHDWSKKAIRLALENKGITIEDIENELGVGKGTARNVFYRDCPSYEETIAQKIGVTPDIIWPSRYSSDERQTA